MSKEMMEKAKKIKLAIFDVDGVFTDGRIFIDDKGIEIKAFHVLDGQGIKLLQQGDIQIAIISGRDAPGVAFRMQQLGIQHIFMGQSHKLPIYENLLNTFQFEDHEIAYMGDDLPDLAILKRVGLAVTVPNAAKEVLERTPFVTKSKGGKGAVREVCEFILKAQGKWEEVVGKYL
jgi:3-deoxy-D-manno-octulosonate 8-phosphate phosphatase (KDO 8-P phosphatase)